MTMTSAPATERYYPPVPKDGARETIESIVIAFVLAFLFKTFEAEAFVIPTGSMAPTLRGLHFDVQGDLSGYRSAYGTPQNLSEPIDNCIEPLYGHPMPLYPDPNAPLPQRNKNFYAYSGDRILVSKIAYMFHDPERWDVVVFKYPGEAQTNFIKRLVGLPNETVRIYRGDVSAAPTG
ncbi:MAG TPA: signal peptidase I, partial [Pirellulales bacterium]